MKTAKQLTDQQLVEFLSDLKYIAEHWQWCATKNGHPEGYRLAGDRIAEIHKGKYGMVFGLWPQVDSVIDELRKRLTE